MSVEDRVIKVLESLCGISSIDKRHTLQRDLMMDSLQLVLLLVSIEDEFQIELEESDMNPFDLFRVVNVVDLVERYIGGHDEKISTAGAE